MSSKDQEIYKPMQRKKKLNLIFIVYINLVYSLARSFLILNCCWAELLEVAVVVCVELL